MEKLKPEISKEEVKALIDQYYGLVVDEIQELNGYDDCNFYCKINDEKKGLIEMNFKVTNHKETAEENLLGEFIGQAVPRTNLISSFYSSKPPPKTRITERSVLVRLWKWHQRADTNSEHQRQLPGENHSEKQSESQECHSTVHFHSG